MIVFLVVSCYTHLKVIFFYGGAGQIKWGFGGFDRMLLRTAND